MRGFTRGVSILFVLLTSGCMASHLRDEEGRGRDAGPSRRPDAGRLPEARPDAGAPPLDAGSADCVWRPGEPVDVHPDGFTPRLVARAGSFDLITSAGPSPDIIARRVRVEGLTATPGPASTLYSPRRELHVGVAGDVLVAVSLFAAPGTAWYEARTFEGVGYEPRASRRLEDVVGIRAGGVGEDGAYFHGSSADPGLSRPQLIRVGPDGDVERTPLHALPPALGVAEPHLSLAPHESGVAWAAAAGLGRVRWATRAAAPRVLEVPGLSAGPGLAPWPSDPARLALALLAGEGLTLLQLDPASGDVVRGPELPTSPPFSAPRLTSTPQGVVVAWLTRQDAISEVTLSLAHLEVSGALRGEVHRFPMGHNGATARTEIDVAFDGLHVVVAWSDSFGVRVVAMACR